MVAGNEIFDWAEFEKVSTVCTISNNFERFFQNTAYHGEYWVKHPTVRMFWDVFHSLSDGEKKKFLLFLTGCARVPLLGMKELKVSNFGCAFLMGLQNLVSRCKFSQRVEAIRISLRRIPATTCWTCQNIPTPRF